MYLNVEETGRSDTQKSAPEERRQRHIENGTEDVDGPVGQNRSHSQEDYVVQQVVAMSGHLRLPVGNSIGKPSESIKIPFSRTEFRVLV